MPTYTTQEIAAQVQGELIGPADLSIRGAETLELAQPGQLTFIGDIKYAPAWTASRASAALLDQSIALTDPGPGRAFIRVANADLAMALVLDLLAPPRVRPAAGVHPSAVIDPTAQIGAGVAIGAHCYVGAGVRIADETILHPNVTILDECTVGPRCEFYPGVVLRERCTIGARCIFHAGAVIGADGFGYRPAPGGRGLIKITHIGTVTIGNDVEIGANACVDRGKFSATVIGDGTKLDNLVQIGHNCRIGRACVFSGQVGLAGSVTVGDGVMMGGKVGVRDHLTIGNRVKIAGYAAIMEDIPDGQVWAGYPAQERRGALREHLAVRKLPALIEKVEHWLASSGGPPQDGASGPSR